MFVRKKKVGSHEYYQLVENRRERGKVRQRVLAHLGRYESLEDNLEDLERNIAEYRQAARDHRKKVEEERKKIPPSWLDERTKSRTLHEGRMRSMVSTSRLKKLARRIEELKAQQKPPCPECGGRIVIYEKLADGTDIFPRGEPCPACWNDGEARVPGHIRSICVVRPASG